jgi:hypothetical protein
MAGIIGPKYELFKNLLIVMAQKTRPRRNGRR